MNATTLGAIAVRFYALMLIVGALLAAPMTLSYLAVEDDSSGKWMAAASLLWFVVSLATAAFLFLRTATVVRWVVPDLAAGTKVEPPRANELGVLAFSLAGLVFVVHGVERIIWSGAQWYFSASDSLLGTREWTSHDKSDAVAAVLMIAIGLWLMLGSRGLLRAVQRLQRPPISDTPGDQ